MFVAAICFEKLAHETISLQQGSSIPMLQEILQYSSFPQPMNELRVDCVGTSQNESGVRARPSHNQLIALVKT